MVERPLLPERIADKIVEVCGGELRCYEGGYTVSDGSSEGASQQSQFDPEDYLSRIIVTGPSLTSSTSIIAPKEPVFTEPIPASRSFSQK